jgi:hypothetical protein
LDPEPVRFAPPDFAISRLTYVWFEHEFGGAEENVRRGEQRACIGQVEYPAAHGALALLKDNQGTLHDLAARALPTLNFRFARCGGGRNCETHFLIDQKRVGSSSSWTAAISLVA